MSRAIVVLAMALSIVVVGACSSAASSGSTASASAVPGSTAIGSTASGGGASLREAAAKEALLARFGPLSFCDPDFYPVAEGDEADLATQHLPAMRADAEAWAAIAARLGFDPMSTPSGAQLLAAYREWKMFRALDLKRSGDGWGFDASFGAPGPDASASAAISHVVGTIAADGTISVDRQEPGSPPRCPICLARDTRIATPNGEVVVEALAPGDVVWTLDGQGRRVAAAVIRVGSTRVPADHEIIRLVLADGRGVLASPGHPLRDGRPVAALRPGESYDGSVVVGSERIPYAGGRTFDLLPASATGVYWANGIELKSTLGP
jgi:hypothetical protein